jgi:hypothetical protein
MPQTNNYRLFLKPPAVQSLLLLEGVSRAGKMLLGKLVSNFRDVEFFQLVPALDHIPMLCWLGVMTREDAVAFLRLQIDSFSYDRAIGRNLNMREEDSTSLTQALASKAYLERSATPDATAVWEAFTGTRRIPSYLVHEMMPHIDLYFDAVPAAQVIQVDRHPVDLAQSWYRRGWGERWGADPLAFVPVVAHGERPIPWFAAEWADEFCALAPVDRVVRSLAWLRARYKETLLGLPQARRERIFVITYEALVERPRETLAQVATFVGTAPLDGFDTVLKREGLPGKALAPSRAEKQKALQAIMSKESIQLLAAATDEYERQWPAIPVS